MNERGESIVPLQDQLRDLLCLAIVGDHVRWVLRGDDTTKVASWLAAAVIDWRTRADAVARRLGATGTAPDGRVRALARDVPWNWVPDGWLTAREAVTLMQDRLLRVTGWAEARRSASPVGTDERLLGDVHAGLQAQLEALSSM
jgi:DNA-binding ferritin-like protein